jgi:hypothetical protein
MTMPLTRPALRRIPLQSVWPPRRGRVYITMSPEQWDPLLQVSYDEGWILLEVDDNEQPVAAYCMSDFPPEPSRN